MGYDNLTDADFKYYKAKLKKLEMEIENFSRAAGFILDQERYYNESLAINLKTGNENILGNICFQYLDQPGPTKFRLGLIKTQDKAGYRYFKKVSIQDDCPIEFFAKNVFDLLDKAFREYNSIGPEDLNQVFNFLRGMKTKTFFYTYGRRRSQGSRQEICCLQACPR